MVSIIKAIYNYFFPDKSAENEAYVSNEIFKFERRDPLSGDPTSDVWCEGTGVITYMGKSFVVIDETLYFDITKCEIYLAVMDRVTYLGYEDESGAIVVVKIVRNHGPQDEEIYRQFVGDVYSVQGQIVFYQGAYYTLQFNLDFVTGPFIPIRGDWLKLRCKMKYRPDTATNCNFHLIKEVISYKACNRKVQFATITSWNGKTGTCDNEIFFAIECITNNISPTVGAKVIIEAIESNQGRYRWRALEMQITGLIVTSTRQPWTEDDPEIRSFY